MVQLNNAALGLLISAGASLVAAAPAPVPTSAPDLANAAKRSSGTACTFTDATAVSKSKASCATIVIDSITVPAGTTLDLTDLEDGTAVEFTGTTTFEYEEWSGPLLSISGTDIVVTGASGNSLDGLGAKYWDGEGSNGGVTKPKFFYAHSLKGTSSISGLNILNTPVQAISVNSAEGLTLDSITIDNSAGDSGDLGHNTDAFDVGSSSDITISNAVVKNQDDCLAINSGTSITFTGGSCSGGHGLSIGSVGGRSDNTVEDITISSSTISDSANGVRIKTVSGATGSVSGVTYKDITLDNISSYGIVIEQDYENGSPTGTPTTGVPITNLTVSGVTGSVASGGVNIYILCGDGACSDWTWTDVSVTGGDDSSDCLNIPDGASCSSSGSTSSSSNSSAVSSATASSTVASSTASSTASSAASSAASSSVVASSASATSAAASSTAKSSSTKTTASASSTKSSKSSKSTSTSTKSSKSTKTSSASSTAAAKTEVPEPVEDDTCDE